MSRKLGRSKSERISIWNDRPTRSRPSPVLSHNSASRVRNSDDYYVDTTTIASNKNDIIAMKQAHRKRINQLLCRPDTISRTCSDETATTTSSDSALDQHHVVKNINNNNKAFHPAPLKRAVSLGAPNHSKMLSVEPSKRTTSWFRPKQLLRRKSSGSKKSYRELSSRSSMFSSSSHLMESSNDDLETLRSPDDDFTWSAEWSEDGILLEDSSTELFGLAILDDDEQSI